MNDALAVIYRGIYLFSYPSRGSMDVYFDGITVVVLGFQEVLAL